MLPILLAALLVTPGVHLIRGEFVPGSQPDGNTVILEAPDGLIVIDTGRHASHTNQIIEFAARSKKPVKAIINTHWHLDHVGGNILLRREYPDVEIYGSNAIEEARKGFLASYRRQLDQIIRRTDDAEKQKPFRAEAALIDAGAQLVPDVVVTTSGARTIAGRKLRINVASHATTAADVWVFDPATKVLVAGDLVTLPTPFLDTACPSGWQRALGEVAKVRFETLIPGHGAPMTREQFDVYRTAFDKFVECKCTEGWVKHAAPLLEGTDEKFTRMLGDYYAKVLATGGVCPPPEAQTR